MLWRDEPAAYWPRLEVLERKVMPVDEQRFCPVCGEPCPRGRFWCSVACHKLDEPEAYMPDREDGSTGMEGAWSE